MRIITAALALSGMLTIEQRDSGRQHLDPPSAVISEDGRFVAFTTLSRLVPADFDHQRDVYILDRLEHRVTLESAALDGRALSDSAHPAVSGDGRFLVFESSNGIVLRDRDAGSTRILADGRLPAISLDGRIVAFTSDVLKAVRVWDLQSGSVISVVEPNRAARTTAGAGVNPSLSADGRFMAFAVGTSVFVYDRHDDTTERLASGWDPAISADGRTVAYVSRVERLAQVFVMDRQTGKALIVSRNTTGGKANGSSTNPAISSDGRIVAFQSEASNLVEVEDFNLLWDVFVFDRQSGVTKRVSGDADGGWMEPSGGPALDGSGTIMAFSSRHPTDAADTHNDFDLFVTSSDNR